MVKTGTFLGLSADNPQGFGPGSVVRLVMTIDRQFEASLPPEPGRSTKVHRASQSRIELSTEGIAIEEVIANRIPNGLGIEGGSSGKDRRERVAGDRQAHPEISQ
jgi:hypothetical protein